MLRSIFLLVNSNLYKFTHLVIHFLFSVSSFFGDYTGDGSKCYTMADNIAGIETINNNGGRRLCQLRCRALGHHSTLVSSSDSDCHCAKGALKVMAPCTGSGEYKHFSTGLGFPPVSFTVWPELSTESLVYNTDVLDSQFVKVSSITKEIKLSFS